MRIDPDVLAKHFTGSVLPPFTRLRRVVFVYIIFIFSYLHFSKIYFDFI